jgi:iron-sulfur cluster repair protein YtfE (RIC family)
MIHDYLAEQHRTREEHFGITEEAAAAGDWKTCAARLQQLAAGMLQHFDIEELDLFPRFEERTGMAGGGPTAIMRDEHDQIRELLAQLDEACAKRDASAFLGASETLGVLVQQHHLKEETILFPMCERVLGAEQGEIVDAMSGRDARAAKADG